MQSVMIENYGFNGNRYGIYHTQICHIFQDTEMNAPLFAKAIEISFRMFPNLRTIFNLHNQTQSINCDPDLKVPLKLIDLTYLTDYETQVSFIQDFMENDKKDLFDMSGLLCRYFVFKISENKIGFLPSIHHCILDGWGEVIYLKTLFKIYTDLKSSVQETKAVEVLPYIYRDFLEYEQQLSNNQEYISFWNNYINETYFEVSLKKMQVSLNEKNIVLKKHIQNFSFKNIQNKIGSIPKAFFLAAYIRTIDDIIFKNKTSNYAIGVVSNGGRTIDIAGSLTAYGLFWNMVPFKRVHLDDTAKHIKLVHDGLLSIDAYAGFPLKQILENKSNDILFSYNFTKFHSLDDADDGGNFKMIDTIYSDIFHYPLNLAVDLNSGNNRITISFEHNREYISNETAAKMFEHYCSTLQIFLKYFDESI
jgi:hypothetical protein